MPSSPLNQTPMLAPSRNTTEQRFYMDAVELGNDSGSLLAHRNGRFSLQQEEISQPDSTLWTLDQHWTGSSSGQANGRTQKAGGRAGDRAEPFSSASPSSSLAASLPLDSKDLSSLWRLLTMLATHGRTNNGLELAYSCSEQHKTVFIILELQQREQH